MSHTTAELWRMQIPTNTQTASEWSNTHISVTLTDYRRICDHLQVSYSATESGKVALTRAILASRKTKGGSGETSTQTQANTQTHTQTHTDMNKTTSGEKSATDLLKEAFEKIGIQSNSKPSDTLSEGQVAQIVDLIGIHSKPTNKHLIVEDYNGNKVDVGVHHSALPMLIKLASTREHLYLHGPAGTGKSHLAWQIAQSLQLDFACMSFCGQSTKTDLVGYMDAQGKYVPTPFYTLYKEGGVFCLDEMDAANPNLINLLNGGLAGKMMSFPCGMVDRHPNFICVASANTFGTGSTEQYIGRNPLDAASLDRFQKYTIDYCQSLEASLFSDTACRMVWQERDRLAGRTGWVLSMRTLSRIDKYLSIGMTEAEAYDLAIASQLNKNLRK